MHSATRAHASPLALPAATGHFPVVLLSLICGDIELNLGPSAAFTVCTLRIRSHIDDSHFTDVSDIADSDRPNRSVLLKHGLRLLLPLKSLMLLYVVNLTYPHTPRFHKSCQNIGGTTAYFATVPFTQAPSAIRIYISFVASAVTLRLHFLNSRFLIYTAV